jgi:hypothetical protein
MKITIEKDDNTSQVFEDITDAYLSIRRAEPMMSDKGMAVELQTRSYSWGSNLREIAKELSQSLVEIQSILRGGRDNHAS